MSETSQICSQYLESSGPCWLGRVSHFQCAPREEKEVWLAREQPNVNDTGPSRVLHPLPGPLIKILNKDPLCSLSQKLLKLALES